jgi:NAD(P)H-hydrate epimerase
MAAPVPEVAAASLPWITTEQMVEVDRAMVEDYRIDLVRRMENAGRNLAHLARSRFLSSDPREKRVVVLAGSGGNGGGALVAARRLHGYGAKVEVFLTKSGDELTRVPFEQLEILHRLGVEIGLPADLARYEGADLVIDGVIGYSLRGAPRGGAEALIRWANAQEGPLLSLDGPSGLDAAAGRVFDPVAVATATMTLALPKKGLRTPGVEGYVGELYLADIGVPPGLYSELFGIDVGPLFAESDLLLIV